MVDCEGVEDIEEAKEAGGETGSVGGGLLTFPKGGNCVLER